MRPSLKSFTIVILLFSFLCLTGCGGATTRLFSKPIAESTYVTYQEWGPNRTVAVMPFENVSKDKSAGLKVRELFVTELFISGAFQDVVDEGEMREVMNKLKIRETDPLGKDTIKTLGDNLGVQALIFANVEEYTERTTHKAHFAMSARMVDVETGAILWYGQAFKEGGGGIAEALGLSSGPTVIELSRGVVEDLIDDLAGEILDRKVESVEVEERAQKDTGQKTAKPADNNQAPASQPVAQAGANPSPAVKATSSGMSYTPVPVGQ